MKTAAIITLLLIVFTSAINVRRRVEEQPNWQNKLVQFAESNDIAKNVVSQVQLGLSSEGAKVDEVIALVQQAQENAQTEFNGLTLESQAETGRITAQINDLSAQLDNLNDEQTQTVNKINTLTSDIAYLNTEIANLENDLAALDERQKLLGQARENDVQAFDTRQRRDASTIAALEQIIPALENLLNGGKAFLQKSTEDIKFALKRIPENKPLTALVEVSTSFDPVQLGNVINKLKEILEAVVKGKEEDETNELASKTKFEALDAQIDSLRTEKYGTKTQKKGELLGKTALLEGAQSKKRNIEVNIQDTSALKTSTVDLLATTQANYERRISDAENVIKALRTVLEILSEGKDSLAASETSAESTLANAQQPQQ